MLMCMYFLRDAVKRMENLSATIEADLKKETPALNFTMTRGNAIQAYIDMKAQIEESMWLLEEPPSEIATVAGLIPVLERLFLQAQTLEELRNGLEAFVQPIKLFDGYDNLSYWDCKSSSRMTANSEDIDTAYLTKVASAMNRLTRPLKVLDPYCRDGNNMRNFQAAYHGPMESYVVDVDQKLLSYQKQEFYRVAIGDLKGATISNGVFDVLLLAPPVSLEKKGRNVIEKLEREYLSKCMNYLRPGGLMLYTIPVTHLYREMCTMLAKNLTGVEIRMSGRRLHIFGYRNGDKERTTDKDLLLKLRTLMLHRDDDEFRIHAEEPWNIEIPTNMLEVKMFRGSKLDEDEFDKMYEKSSSTREFWESQKTEKLSEHAKSPLLPFNVGQLGLILTSGCLDGVIDEGNGAMHAVKGRVIKKKDVQQDVQSSRGQVDVTEVTSNRVEINAFLPDGTYCNLA